MALTPEERRALALLEDCIRYHAPVWSPQFWEALATVRTSLEERP